MDDFALRKGSTYGTILIDRKSHRVIDLVPSRERKDVAEKLSEYPNLRVVSRDGSPTYAAAISDASPGIMQISDRFHLLKGLTEACKCVIQGLFKANTAIQKAGRQADKTSEYNSSYWEKETGRDSAEKKHEKNLAQKREAVAQIRSLSEQGFKITEIARKTGRSYATVKKYLKEDYNPESAGYGEKRPGKLKPYEDDIKGMLMRGCTFKEIESTIRGKGYSGAASTIRMYAARERRLIKQAIGNKEMDILERKWLVKLLYKPMEQLEGANKELIARIAEDIDNWLSEVDRLGINEIISFANGLRRDLDAVKNAASHDYNNGLAEGSVNKLKLAKRKMYGRCDFETLRKKVLLREQYKNIQPT